MTIVYLAAPYTHQSARVKAERVELASLAAARLMQLGHVVYSPITHGHRVADHLPLTTAGQHRFWMAQCEPFMRACSRLVVLPLDGWRMSKGVQEELLHFHIARKPIDFIIPPEGREMFDGDAEASVLFTPFQHELGKWNASVLRLPLSNIIKGPWPEDPPNAGDR